MARAALFPDAVVISQHGRERIEYHAELEMARGSNVGVAWEAEIVDDRGQIVHSGLASGSRRASKGDTLVSKAILADLPDGYFELRFRAAITGDSESDLIETVQHIRVEDGKWQEIPTDDWYRFSRVTLAFQDEGGEP